MTLPRPLRLLPLLALVAACGGGEVENAPATGARKLSFVDIPSRKVVQQIDVGRSPHGVWTLDHAPRR